MQHVLPQPRPRRRVARTLGVIGAIVAAVSIAAPGALAQSGAPLDPAVVTAAETPAYLRDNVVVVLDGSGSMNEVYGRSNQVKMQVAKSALSSVLGELPPTTNLGIVAFARNANRPWIVPLGPVDADAVDDAIRGVVAGGKTPLGAHLKIAADRLLEQRAEQRGYGTYRLLVVTDGQASDGPVLDRYLPLVLSRGIVMDVIGVDMAEELDLARQVHSYRRADDPDALVRSLAEVTAEIGAVRSDGTVDESDFELLQGITDEAGEVLLAALVDPGDMPIGEEAAVDSDAGRGTGTGPTGLPSASPDGSHSSAPVHSAPASGAPSPSGGFAILGFGCLVTVVILIVSIIVVVKIIKLLVSTGGR